MNTWLDRELTLNPTDTISASKNIDTYTSISTRLSIYLSIYIHIYIYTYIYTYIYIYIELVMPRHEIGLQIGLDG